MMVKGNEWMHSFSVHIHMLHGVTLLIWLVNFRGKQNLYTMDLFLAVKAMGICKKKKRRRRKKKIPVPEELCLIVETPKAIHWQVLFLGS